MSFKDTKKETFEDFLSQTRDLIANIFRQYPELSDSTALSKADKEYFDRLASKTSTHNELSNALLTLSIFLNAHYKSRVFILIDEYDTPLNTAYHKNYFEMLVEFLKGMFVAALKGNNALEKGIMTGILKLSKNSMISDLNNLMVYSFLNKKYSHSFGFSEQEVTDLFQEAKVSVEMQAVQAWYNGYVSGGITATHNPWSILNCMNNQGELKPYWVQTGDFELLKTILTRTLLQEKVNALITGDSIESPINDHFSFDQIESGEEALSWGLLWGWGYLKVVEDLGNEIFRLKIPNYEIQYTYQNIFIQLIRTANTQRYDSLLASLVTGKVDVFLTELEDFLLRYCSYLDLTQEKDYHLLLLAWTCSLQSTHHVHSNREVGTGRSDLILTPRDASKDWGVILEFKHADAGKGVEFYEGLAKAGLQQINDKQYDVELKQNPNINKILKLALAFYGKQVASQYSIE